MTFKTPLLAAAVMTLSAAVLFHVFQRQLSAAVPFTPDPAVLSQLAGALEAQKTLARLDPENRVLYRRQFDDLETTLHRLQILEHSRDSLERRYQTLLLVLFGVCVVVVTGVYSLRQSRNQPRLARLQAALTRLAEGEDGIEVGDRGRDVIGRMADMIESTSRVMTRDRRRLAALRNLSSWQEAARRHAHEMRTPLTGARLELTRLIDLVEGLGTTSVPEIRRAAVGVREELDRLGRFTEQFTSFARLRRPDLQCQDLVPLLDEFVSTYRGAWSNLELTWRSSMSTALVAVDRDMLRQVLANLCDNSSAALEDRSGAVGLVLERNNAALHLDVTDDGPGVDEAVRARLFEPYTTARTVGEGMGLGLAISKKILLEHGGDLELLRSSPGCTTFRLTLPVHDPPERTL